jgi:hypothetical protein
MPKVPVEAGVAVAADIMVAAAVVEVVADVVITSPTTPTPIVEIGMLTKRIRTIVQMTKVMGIAPVLELIILSRA